MNERPKEMNPEQDKLSAAALRILDALLVRNPERTAIGVALGLSIYGVGGAFQPIAANRGIDLGRFNWWVSISLGLVVMHLPFVLSAVRHKPLISDELESLIKVIESTNIGEVEKRIAYRKVVNKCIDEFTLSGKSGAIKNILVAEIEGAQQKLE